MKTLPLAILLTGCAADPQIIEVPVIQEVVRVETVPVPAGLLDPCTVELTELETNQDLERALAAALLELERCTRDKRAIGELE